MKTTVDISPTLLTAAKKRALRERTTLRALIERGLRQVLAEPKGSERFRLRKATFKGKGLQHGVAEGDWDHIRDLAYESHGA
jgi:hypothetical protein